MSAALYNADILRLATNIPHHHRLEHPDSSVEKRSPVCGSRIVVDVKLDETGRITALGQEVRACALGQASAALMASGAIGRTATELAEARDSLTGYLAGSAVGPPNAWGLEIFGTAIPYKARHASIRLPFEAVAEAAAKARAPA